MLLQTLLVLPTAQKDQTILAFNKILTEPTFHNIVKTIYLIEDDPHDLRQTRQNTLERIRRYTKSAAIKNRKNAAGFVPPVNDDEMIYVNFSGLGAERDLEHYAVAWWTNRKDDQIVVIPTSSYKDWKTNENHLNFNIGHVGFLAKQTVVNMDQITSISRKRITKTKHINPADGRPYYVSLSPDQKDRIRDGFRILSFGNKSLHDEQIANRAYPDRLPQFEDPTIQYAHLHRPYRIVSDTPETLEYSLYNDKTVTFKLHRKLFDPLLYNKKQLIDNWVNAKGTTGTPLKLRQVVIDETYQLLQNATLDYETRHAAAIIAPNGTIDTA
ncbi:MAG: hypothetical protein WDZ91_16380 [Paenibacillaceae bacterium]